MGGIRDHEQEIYDLIRSNSTIKWGVNNVARTLHMQLNKVVEGYDNLTKSGLLSRHERDKDWPYPYYTPNPDLIENHLGFRKDSIEIYQKNISEKIKSLKRKKIFVNIKREKTETGGKLTVYKRNKTAKPHYEGFKWNLSRLIYITSTLPFAQVLGIIPKKPKYNKMIMETQRQVLRIAKKQIDQLCKDHKDYADIIQDDLRRSIPVFEELQRMPNYFKKS